MAQTIIAQPQDFTPAYNPVKYIIDSTNKNLTGFRYTFQIEAGIDVIGTFKVLPTYGTGYGEIDLSKLLSSYVKWDFDPTVTQDQPAPNSFMTYNINVGEEYLYEITYTSALTASGTITRVNVVNIFAVGDQINIVQADGGVANPLLEGLLTVTASSGTWFEVNVPFSSITDVNIDGTVSYADNLKIIEFGVTTIKNKYVFNGAVTWVDFVTYNEQDYVLNGVTKQWLTNQPTTDFQCTLGQDLWLNSQAIVGSQIYFQNSDGDVYSKNIITNEYIVQVAVGPNNYGGLIPLSASPLPMIKPDTTYYDFWYQNALGQYSQKYRINIDRRVQINEYVISFLDRKGSFSSFAFQLKSYERGEVTRDEFNKDVVGFVSGGEWGYNYDEFGFNTFNINVTKTLELNTNWMTQNMSDYFQELVTSPQTFLKLVQYVTTEDGTPLLDEDGCPYHSAESTAYVPCIVQTNSFEVFQQRNKNLIKQSIVVKLANNDNVNG
ncbi:hypothetical protein UFOVP280_3 [uncultured Caudovirales phage]|uniref:Uncharacterized protein n=1 Tax=uncultured Caudovirales phage TaxID=2100421 RepID=A0A6J5LNG6_9CAUD|nr:hypothetical protein UFOVP280_3 [uncultured Caudovirales phage]